MSYVIITPVRDEEKYVHRTIQSVISQTIRPLEWVIVNDGSIDSTGEIINECTKQYSWIHLINRQNRGFRKSGGGVIDAFYDGYSSLDSKDWDFIVKLDGDLSFEPDYFERCFEYFNADKKLGICGGAIYYTKNGYMEREKTPNFHVRGATKIYKRECWEAIGGLLRAPGWDTLDEVKANMLGWKTQTFSDLEVIHHRPTGKADGTWRNLVKHGRANYIAGYHPLFMIIKCIRRIFIKPYIIGSIGIYHGFLSSYITKTPQYDDREVIRYLRIQQLNRLFFKNSIWK